VSPDPLGEIRRLYFETTAGSVKRDLARAIELFKQIPSEEDRERAAVYMDGLSEMRSEWALAGKPSGGAGAGAGTGKGSREPRGRR
jgi:hypothetical protein